jgi:CheY-like chemotaxis protein
MKNPAMKLHVLVVDDTADMAQAMTAYLRLAGMRGTVASGGAEGLRLAAELRPDVILLDMLMPGMNGLEVLKRLRADSTTTNIAVVVFTASSGPELLEEIRAAGADGYWIKNRLEVHNIAELVESVCRRHVRDCGGGGGGGGSGGGSGARHDVPKARD